MIGPGPRTCRLFPHEKCRSVSPLRGRVAWGASARGKDLSGSVSGHVCGEIGLAERFRVPLRQLPAPVPAIALLVAAVLVEGTGLVGVVVRRHGTVRRVDQLVQE